MTSNTIATKKASHGDPILRIQNRRRHHFELGADCHVLSKKDGTTPKCLSWSGPPDFQILLLCQQSSRRITPQPTLSSQAASSGLSFAPCCPVQVDQAATPGFSSFKVHCWVVLLCPDPAPRLDFNGPAPSHFTEQYHIADFTMLAVQS